MSILFLILQNISAQDISAKIVDENNQALIGATVYFDGTTKGVITNLDGVFSIKKPEKILNPTLVISYLGYETLMISDLENLKTPTPYKQN